MAKQFTLNDLSGKSGTIEGDKSFVFAQTRLVDGLSKNVFSRAGFAGQQNAGIGGGYLPGERYGFLNGRRLTNDILKTNWSFGLSNWGRTSSSLQCFLGSLRQQGDDSVVVVTFYQIVKSAVFDGLYAIGDIAISGKQDYLGKRVFLFDIGGKVYAIAVGQFDVAQHHREILLGQFFEPGLAITCLTYFVILQLQKAGK